LTDTITIIKKKVSPTFLISLSTAPTAVSRESKKKVSLIFDSWNKKYKGDNQQTILEQGEKAGLILPYSCRSGMCGRCKVKLVKGQVEQLSTDGLTEAEMKDDYILMCSCIPTTDVTLIR